ncbi:MAG: PilZ domain-containing protein [Gammaproteobacteria bacterium]|nr:MAG: PilZ domain-containing protein [Gammaproteobacteria bacterium]
MLINSKNGEHMALDYSEKRNFFRMNLDCSMEYSVNGSGAKKSGVVRNLSGDGILFIADQHVAPGTEVHISITPENSVTPPLNVTVEVLRCDRTTVTEFEIAGNITKR